MPLLELPIENNKHPNFEWKGGGRGVDSFVISSEVTLFECNISTILSPFVEEWLIFLIRDYVLALKLFPIVCC